MDGSVLYNSIIVNYTHMILGMWIIVTIQIFYRKNKKSIDKMCEMRAWKTLNAYTMPIYISHYAFLVGNFNVSRLNVGMGLELVIFVVATVVLAYLVKQISNVIYFVIKKRMTILS